MTNLLGSGLQGPEMSVYCSQEDVDSNPCLYLLCGVCGLILLSLSFLTGKVGLDSSCTTS